MARTAAALLKEERIEIRANREIKDFIQRAADVMGTTLSAFAIQQLYEAAKKVLLEKEALTLNNQERDRFISLMDAPPRATHALKALFKKHSR